MEILYILFGGTALFAECSKTIDTRNLVKKFGLLAIIVSCILDIASVDNNLMAMGAFSYILADLWTTFRKT